MSNLSKSVYGQISKLNPTQIALWVFFNGHKNRPYTSAELKDKVPGLPKQPNAAIKALVDAGLVTKTDEKKFVMERELIEILKDERQLGIGGKVHTTLTQNANTIFYPGDRLRYATHTLSWQHKVGIPIWEGEVKSFHVNEEGFGYLAINEDIPTEQIVKSFNVKDVKGAPIRKGALFSKTVMKKTSNVELLNPAVPSGSSKNLVFYKTKSGLNARVLELPQLIGDQVIHFGCVWSGASVEVAGILQELEQHKNFKGKITFHEVDVDENLNTCARFKLRKAPTVIIMRNGNVLKTVQNIPSEKAGETLYKAITAAFAKK
jgi:thioredoxin 1